VRTDYLHPLQHKYEAEIKRIEMTIGMTESKPEIAVLKKQIDDISKKMDECLKYDQIIKHVADVQIEIDLDDGVTVNYGRFQYIEVPQGDGKPPIKMNLLGKI
jgi:hypothetical protein